MPMTSTRLHLRKCLKNRFLKKPSIFQIKNFVPTNSCKFLKNDMNLLKNKKKFFEIFEKIIFLTLHKSLTNKGIEKFSFISDSLNLPLQQCQRHHHDCT
jgi:hypothetical protein